MFESIDGSLKMALTYKVLHKNLESKNRHFIERRTKINTDTYGYEGSHTYNVH